MNWQLDIAGLTMTVGSDGLAPTADLCLNLSVVERGATHLAEFDEIIFDSGGLYEIRGSSRLPGWRSLSLFDQSEAERLPYCTVVYDLKAGVGEIVVARDYHGLGQSRTPLAYPLDHLLWVQLLGEHGGLILHGSGALFADGAAICLAGPSGAGKTTFSRLLSRARPAAAQLSDDRVVIRDAPTGGFTAYGTPWPGDARVVSSARGPLNSLCFLTHAPSNRLTSLTGAAAMTRLLRCSFLPFYDAAAMEKALKFIATLIEAVPCYDLEWTPTLEIASFLERNLGATFEESERPQIWV